MREKVSVLRKSVDAVRTAATYDAAKIGPVPEFEQWRVRVVSFHDETTAAAAMSVGVLSGGKYYPIEQVLQTAVLAPWSEKVDFWVRGGDEVEFRFYTGAAADVLHAWIYGERVFIDSVLE